MSETYETYYQASLEGIDSATSLQVSEGGALLLGSQDGPTTDPSGPDRAHANLSARQAKETGLLTSGTCGPLSTGSYDSAALSAFLANKLRGRKDCAGSTLYRVTWKLKDTRSRRLIYVLQASARRTSDKGFTGLPTPIAGKSSPQKRDDFTPTLANVATLFSGVRSPSASDGVGGVMDMVRAEREGLDPKLKLRDEAALFSGVVTPMAGTPKRGKNSAAGNTDYSRSIVQAFQMDLPGDSGKMQTGSHAETVSIGLLNPAYSRWLMGLPKEWDDCAPTAMRSSRKSQRRS
jgi:hypothetical protein